MGDKCFKPVSARHRRRFITKKKGANTSTDDSQEQDLNYSATSHEANTSQEMAFIDVSDAVKVQADEKKYMQMKQQKMPAPPWTSARGKNKARAGMLCRVLTRSLLTYMRASFVTPPPPPQLFSAKPNYWERFA